jgi:peptidoglycan/xylan/chitin deacetylase (PgdA/CDA1 family)
MDAAPVWPNAARAVVVLSVDIDGAASWLNRGPEFARYPSILSMGEYGPTVGVPRILDLLEAEGVPATFFVPGFEAEHHPALMRDILARGHEIAHHGYRHEYVWTLGAEQERETFQRGLRALEDATGQTPRGWRAPGFELSPYSLDLLTEHGFVYSSSQMGNDIPYPASDRHPELVELPVSWMLDDFAFFLYLPMVRLQSPPATPDHAFAVWAAEFDGLYRFGRCFILTLHPELTGRPSRLAVLERLIHHIKARPDVAFLRAIDLAEHWIRSRRDRPAARGDRA